MKFQTFNDNGGFFPKIARGHGQHCLVACSRAKTLVAHYDNKRDAYVDGHYQEQAVAERAHREGYR